MADRRKPTIHERWAHLKFSVVGPLLAAPPSRGELRAEIENLAAKSWLHPATERPSRFGASTIERWYYRAKNARLDPVGELRRKIRKDNGTRKAMGDKLRQALLAQYASHKSWSYQLHHDNLAAQVESEPTLGRVPSYATVRRYMKAAGLAKRRRLTAKDTAAARRAESRLEQREVRSYEAAYVDGLWHLDFHHGSKKVLTAAGEWATPFVLGILDDRSRLACHLQWYLGETAENLVHGLVQAIQKRGLPRALMTDNGPAEIAAEVQQGLLRLGIVPELTLAHSPYQNGKQESFWGQVEGRLLAMLEGSRELTLATLNEATQAWVELEYNRKDHSETGEPPLQRHLKGPAVGRPSPSSEALRLAFMAEEHRTQRKSDGTVSIEGRRFEIPSRYRHLDRVAVRYARWDLGHVHLVDDRTSQVLCRTFPLDRTGNADGARRALDPVADPALPLFEPPPEPGIAPLLKKLMAERAATGLPPAYLPKDERPTRED
ncbi:MAG: DDE-type integrase/transposase/recombinase [Deltaproteobacteria bacterium]|nr:DDE-type integrase/transposase/recombinase [Deltaproteobacteria bacterium]